MSLPYRRDIEGLRTVAVLPVIIFHMGAKGLSGGFTGVDIFFVISGYLITGLIVGDLGQSQFSILDFYKRRILRILPALLCVVAFTVIAAGILLAPSEIEAVSQSALAALTFVSNVYFYSTAGYFDLAASEKPLLHTWSLGVEEQFYLFYPLFLWAAYKVDRRVIRPLVSGLAVVSFVTSLLIREVSPEFAFYMLPARFWELALGGLIALGACPVVENGRGRMILSLAGAGMMATGFFAIRSTAAFPGLWALLPCLGVSLVIAYGPATTVGWLLSTRVMTGIGRLSYSLYLWHWPVIVVHQMPWMTPPSASDRWMTIPGTIGLALFSFVLVERPFRSARARSVSSGKVILSGVAAMTVVAGLSFGIAHFAERLSGLNPEMVRIGAFSNYMRRGSPVPEAASPLALRNCTTDSGTATWRDFDQDSCLRLSADKPNYLLIGDSHAGHIAVALAEIYPDINVLVANTAGCEPVYPLPDIGRCRVLFGWLLDTWLPGKKLDGIILSARWTAADAGPLVLMVDRLKQPGRDLVVFGPIVEYERPLPEVIVASMQQNEPAVIKARRTPNRGQPVDRVIAEAVRTSGARYVSVFDTLCPGDVCTVLTDAGIPVQYDYGHLTLSGSRMLMSRIASLLKLPPHP